MLTIAPSRHPIQWLVAGLELGVVSICVALRGECERVPATHSHFQRVLSLATQRNATHRAAQLMWKRRFSVTAYSVRRLRTSALSHFILPSFSGLVQRGSRR